MRAIVVLSTTPDKKSARRIARMLVRKKLAACVSLGPAWESTYRWKGKVETASEVLILAKTSRERLKALQKAVLEIHPYDVPEILALPVAAMSAGYAAWLKKSLGL